MGPWLRSKPTGEAGLREIVVDGGYVHWTYRTEQDGKPRSGVARVPVGGGSRREVWSVPIGEYLTATVATTGLFVGRRAKSHG